MGRCVCVGGGKGEGRVAAGGGQGVGCRGVGWGVKHHSCTVCLKYSVSVHQQCPY